MRRGPGLWTPRRDPWGAGPGGPSIVVQGPTTLTPGNPGGATIPVASMAPNPHTQPAWDPINQRITWWNQTSSGYAGNLRRLVLDLKKGTASVLPDIAVSGLQVSYGGAAFYLTGGYTGVKYGNGGQFFALFDPEGNQVGSTVQPDTSNSYAGAPYGYCPDDGMLYQFFTYQKFKFDPFNISNGGRTVISGGPGYYYGYGSVVWSATDGLFYIVGERGAGNPSSNTPRRDLFSFEPRTQTWKTLHLQGSYDGRGSTHWVDGYVIHAGNGGGAVYSAWNLSAGGWTDLPSSPTNMINTTGHLAHGALWTMAPGWGGNPHVYVWNQGEFWT